MGAKRRNFKPDFKFKVAREALSERETLSELAEKYKLHPNQISQWKKVLQDRGAELFERTGKRKKASDEPGAEALYEQIGRLQMELTWLKKKSGHDD